LSDEIDPVRWKRSADLSERSGSAADHALY